MTQIFRGGCNLNNLGSEDVKRVPTLELTKVAGTLLTRDYKGLGNYNCNGVLEIWKIEKSK